VFLLVTLAALGEPGSAQSSPVDGAPADRPTRVAIAEFALLDEKGEAVLRSQAPDADLARMTRLVPAAIGARLVQSAEYDVVELGQGLRPFAEPGGDEATAVPREVASWLARGVADEIITGAAACSRPAWS